MVLLIALVVVFGLRATAFRGTDSGAFLVDLFILVVLLAALGGC